MHRDRQILTARCSSAAAAISNKNFSRANSTETVAAMLPLLGVDLLKYVCCYTTGLLQSRVIGMSKGLSFRARARLRLVNQKRILVAAAVSAQAVIAAAGISGRLSARLKPARAT
jgi:hypothetical protein